MGWLKGGGVEDIPCCRHRGAAPETMCRADRRILWKTAGGKLLPFPVKGIRAGSLTTTKK